MAARHPSKCSDWVCLESVRLILELYLPSGNKATTAAHWSVEILGGVTHGAAGEACPGSPNMVMPSLPGHFDPLPRVYQDGA